MREKDRVRERVSRRRAGKDGDKRVLTSTIVHLHALEGPRVAHRYGKPLWLA